MEHEGVRVQLSRRFDARIQLDSGAERGQRAHRLPHSHDRQAGEGGLADRRAGDCQNSHDQRVPEQAEPGDALVQNTQLLLCYNTQHVPGVDRYYFTRE